MRESFAHAIAAVPCILFVDELDSFCDRVRDDDDNARYTREVIISFLECLDGAEARTGVVVVGATNHPHLFDLNRRAGRLDSLIEILLPDQEARAAILRYHLKDDVPSCDLAVVADAMAGSFGADLEALVRNARRRSRTLRRAMQPSVLLDALPVPVRLTDAAFRRVCIDEAGHVVFGIELVLVTGSHPVEALAGREVRSGNSSRT